jgi:hypothetical protein
MIRAAVFAISLKSIDVKQVQRMRAVHALCDETGDVATASLLENRIDQAQRRICFVFETSQPKQRTDVRGNDQVSAIGVRRPVSSM